MGKSTPAAPDPVRTVQAQAAANKEAAVEQARLNRLNETTPLGSVEFRETGNESVPFERITSLNPVAEETFNQQQALGLNLTNLANEQTGRVQNALGSDIDFSGLTPLPSLDEDARQRIEDSLFERQASRLRSDFGDQQDRLDTRLANQGIQVGSDAFSKEQERFGRTRNDAFDLAMSNAITGAIGEQGRLFGFDQASRNQGLQELLTQRNQPINDISALLSNSQLQIPNFGGISQVGVAAPDVLGAQALSLNQGNVRSQQKQQMANNLFQLGGAVGSAAILSDRRTKSNIRKIGVLRNGLNAYSYNDLWGNPAIGVMADEVKEILPEAVINIHGFDHVNYQRVL